MGWSRGPQLAGEVWFHVRPYLRMPERREVARNIIMDFLGYDADDWCDEQQLLADAGMPDNAVDADIDQFWDELRH